MIRCLKLVWNNLSLCDTMLEISLESSFHSIDNVGLHLWMICNCRYHMDSLYLFISENCAPCLAPGARLAVATGALRVVVGSAGTTCWPTRATASWCGSLGGVLRRGAHLELLGPGGQGFHVQI